MVRFKVRKGPFLTWKMIMMNLSKKEDFDIIFLFHFFLSLKRTLASMHMSEAALRNISVLASGGLADNSYSQ